MTIWQWLIIGYSALALLTFLPTLWTTVFFSKLKDGGASFDDTDFTPETKAKLKAHYTRIYGTLIFWKSQALRNGNFHYYCLCWTIISSAAIPFLSQAIDPNDPASKWFLTLISAHIALLLAFHKGLKAAENFRAYRHGESEFYDLYRRLLDRPKKFGTTEEEQIDNYFDQAEAIRRLVRNAETDNLPSIEDIKTNQKKNEQGTQTRGSNA